MQRCELVEQRHDHIGGDPDQQQLPEHERDPGPKPPERSACIHEPQHQREQWQPQDGAHGESFDQVCDPQFEAGLIEAKALLHTKGLHERQGQAKGAANQHKTNHQGQLLHQTRRHERQQPLVEQIKSTQQGPAQNHQRIQQNVPLRQPGFGQGVIGRLVVVGQGNGLRISLGYGVPVARNMPNLANIEPEPECKVGHKPRSQ